MKVLIDHHCPFALAHGGLQVQIEQTARALGALGVETEWVRWWDETQRGDILHFFGRPPTSYLERAALKGFKTVVSDLLGGTGARSALSLRVQWFATRLVETCFPSMITARMNWDAYRRADAVVALTDWEAHLFRWLFRAPPERTHTIPNGVEDVFLNPPATPVPRGEWLVTTASILPVKRIVETARAAVEAGTPYWVVGRPFSEDDKYYRSFCDIQRAHPELIRYDGSVADRTQLAHIYREARGFVMLSRWESLSVSALEAAACECPLLLTDLPWARAVFSDSVRYWTPGTEISRTLRSFYDAAPRLTAPARPLSWQEVATRLKTLYKALTG